MIRSTCIALFTFAASALLTLCVCSCKAPGGLLSVCELRIPSGDCTPDLATLESACEARQDGSRPAFDVEGGSCECEPLAEPRLQCADGVYLVFCCEP